MSNALGTDDQVDLNEDVPMSGDDDTSGAAPGAPVAPTATVDTKGSNSQGFRTATAIKVDQVSAHQSRRPLSLLAQFDALVRSADVLMAGDEEEMLTVIQQQERARMKWLHLTEEHLRCQPMLDQLTHTCQTLETQLKHARNQIHIELEKRKAAEREREALELQLANIRELLMRNDRQEEEEPGGSTNEEGGLRCFDKDSLLSVLHDFNATNSQLPSDLHTGQGGAPPCRASRYRSSHLVTIDESNSILDDDISFDKTEDDLEVKTAAIKADYVPTKDVGESAAPSANYITFRRCRNEKSPKRQSKAHDKSGTSHTGTSEQESKRRERSGKRSSGLTASNAAEGKKILKSGHISVQDLGSHEALVTSASVINHGETGLAAAFEIATVPVGCKSKGRSTDDHTLRGKVHQGSLTQIALDAALPRSPHSTTTSSSNEPLATAASSDQRTATTMDNETAVASSSSAGPAASDGKDLDGIPQKKNQQHLPNQHLVQAEVHTPQSSAPRLSRDATPHYDLSAPRSQTKASPPRPPNPLATYRMSPQAPAAGWQVQGGMSGQAPAAGWLVQGGVGSQGVVGISPLLSDSSSSPNQPNQDKSKHPPIESHSAPVGGENRPEEKSGKKGDHIYTKVKRKTKQMLSTNRKSPHYLLRDRQLQFAPNLGSSKSDPVPTTTTPTPTSPDYGSVAPPFSPTAAVLADGNVVEVTVQMQPDVAKSNETPSAKETKDVRRAHSTEMMTPPSGKRAPPFSGKAASTFSGKGAPSFSGKGASPFSSPPRSKGSELGGGEGEEEMQAQSPEEPRRSLFEDGDESLDSFFGIASESSSSNGPIMQPTANQLKSSSTLTTENKTASNMASNMASSLKRRMFRSSSHVIHDSSPRFPGNNTPTASLSSQETLPSHALGEETLPKSPVQCLAVNHDGTKSPVQHLTHPHGFEGSKSPVQHLVLTHPHAFVGRVVVKMETCIACGRRVTFGKFAFKCSKCRSMAHPECRPLIPLPCIPVATTPKGQAKGLLSEFAPRDRPMIPGVVVHCIQEVEARGLREQGIYRIPGSDPVVKELLDKFLRGRGSPRLSRFDDIHVICSCLKHFLRRLQEPLVTHALWGWFVQAADFYKQGDSHRAVATLRKAASHLPACNLDTLAFIILHLIRVSQTPACKMPVQNIAKVFGPTVVGYSSPEPEAVQMLHEPRRQVEVMELMMVGVPADYWEAAIGGTEKEGDENGNWAQPGHPFLFGYV